MERVTLRIGGLDGNPFSLLGAFGHAARQQGWSDEKIARVCGEAVGGDYDHLLATLIRYTESPNEADESHD